MAFFNISLLCCIIIKNNVYTKSISSSYGHFSALLHFLRAILSQENSVLLTLFVVCVQSDCTGFRYILYLAYEYSA